MRSSNNEYEQRSGSSPPVIGGILSALTLLVLPILYRLVHWKEEEKETGTVDGNKLPAPQA